MVSLILDTDIALGSVNADIDDALAVLLAVNNSHFAVKAITVSSGNVCVDKASANLAALLKRLGKSDIPHVFSSSLPLDGSLWVKKRWQAQTEQDIPLHDESTASADLMRKTLRESAEPLTVVTVGPLTNVALALSTEPALKKKISQLVMMGGTKSMPGVENMPVEFNILVDPEAASFVFQQGIPTTLFTLDVTKKKKVRPSDIEIWNTEKTPFLQYLYNASTSFMRFRAQRDGYAEPYAFFHDALPLVYLIKPDLFTITPCNVAVDLGGEYSRGMTLIDTKSRNGRGFNAFYASDVQEDAVFDFLMGYITKTWGAIK